MDARLLPMGESAVLVEVADAEAALALRTALRSRRLQLVRRRKVRARSASMKRGCGFSPNAMASRYRS